MLNVRLSWAPVVAVFAACIVASFAPAARAEAPATAFLKGKHDQVARVLKAPAKDPAQKAARDEKITAIIGDLLDYTTLSERSLRDHWAARTPKEREEFVSLLRQLVERNYRSSLEGTLDFNVKYTGEKPITGGVIVSSKARDAKNKRSPEVSIDYEMTPHGGDWVVVDVVTDGVSMVQNYRSQFRRIIEKDGWAGLVGRMKKRLAEGGNDL